MTNTVQPDPKNEIAHVTLVLTDQGWQASVRRKDSTGYAIAHNPAPGIALFDALYKAGIADGPGWVNPNPLQRLKNALDRNLIERWANT